jgi:hypothetical protein
MNPGIDAPQLKYVCVGHQSQDVHIGTHGAREPAEHGGASLFTALTTWLVTGELVAVVSATGHGAVQEAASNGLEAYSNIASPQTIFEDWREGDSRRQRLVSRAPAIDQSLEPLGQRGRNATAVFACPLLDELPLDCRSWFWSEFAALIPQGWFRHIDSNGIITLVPPDVSQITGPWDLIVLSHEEAAAIGDLAAWKKLARVLAVTEGSRGATIYSDDEIEHVPAFLPAEVVDTTGAGDVWAAAFAIRFMETRNITEAGRFASAAGAICVSRRGLRGVPESRAEIERMLVTSRG